MSKPVILVVDDERAILGLMETILKEFGYESILAASGPEAIEAAKARKPDLLIVDINMPGMSGHEVVSTIRGESDIAGIPVIILSGEPVSPNEMRAIGADEAVQKPFELRDLVGCIRRHLARDAN